jgi:hypothetical protein
MKVKHLAAMGAVSVALILAGLFAGLGFNGGRVSADDGGFPVGTIPFGSVPYAPPMVLPCSPCFRVHPPRVTP